MSSEAPKSHVGAEKRRIEAGRKLATPNAGDDIVISGFAGRFPNSDDTAEFLENIMNKVDLCDDDDRRWVHTHPEIPKVSGKINKVDKFDAGHFSAHGGQANSMDPMQRMVLERTFETIVDAGINPDDFAGSNTGVFIGTCYSESEKTHLYEKLQSQAYAILGCQRSMQAQRVSYAFKLNGPSMICDTACSSGLYAFELAYRAIREGKCEQALVGGTNLCFDAYFTLQFARLGVLNMNTGCRPFDENATGYTRSEAIVMMLLQKSKHAKRVYAQIVHAKVNVDGYKELGITYPSANVQKVLLEDVYEECDLDPTKLAFVEAHGTGTKVGDPEELLAIDEVFCTGRDKPLLIGSIKGNIGHTEPASGLCSIIKMIYAMETGFIAPNIHYENPKLSVDALKSKRLEVVTEPTPWPKYSSLGGVNCFGFGGANCHVVMKSNDIEKSMAYDDLPRLVCFSGRTSESIKSFQDNLHNMKLDYEYIALLQQIFKKPIENHIYRGYSILTKAGELCRSKKKYDPLKKNDLYLSIGNSKRYSSRTIEELQNISIFKLTFERINDILRNNNINIDLSATSGQNDILHQLLITVAIQIGVIDILNALNIIPDFIIGTSLGDFTGAYANGILTMNEVILSTYSVSQLVLNSRGNETNLEQIILKSLKGIIYNNVSKNVKVKSPAANIFQYGTPEYFLFNILNPKLLNDMSKNIKNDAIVINIDSDLKSNNKITILNMINPDMDLIGMLESIGGLYEFGFQPTIDELYTKVSWPVSRGTPMISPLIKWNHEEEYTTPTRKVNEFAKQKDPEKFIAVSVTNSDVMFYKGHVIDGRNLFPATGYLYLIWEFYGEIVGTSLDKTKVCFENIKFHRATTFGQEGLIKLYLNIQRSGQFEVQDGNDTTLVTGKFSELSETDLLDFETEDEDVDYETLDKNDVYKELRLRGYNYRGPFRAVQEIKGNKSLIEWTGNWITFMDNMLQISICTEDNRNLYVPTGIDRLLIDAEEHTKYVDSMKTENDNINLPVFINKKSKIIRSRFIEIRGLFANAISRKKQIGIPILETYKFIPNEMSVPLANAIRINIQIILENKSLVNVKVLELIDNESCHSDPFSPEIQSVLGDLPLIQPTMTILTEQDLEVEFKGITIEKKGISGETGNLIFIGSNLLNRGQVLTSALNTLVDGGFILTLEDIVQAIPDNLIILTKYLIGSQQLLLINKKIPLQKSTTINISSNDSGKWLSSIQSAMKSSQNIILYSENEEFSGILGLVNCLRREPEGHKVSCVFIQDIAPTFDVNNKFYRKQLNKGLAFNVFKNGCWGTYRHLIINPSDLVENEHCYANTTVRADISSLKWLEGHLTQVPKDNIVYVYYSSINFRDVMTASGKVPVDAVTTDRLKQECIHGFEYSGRTANGKRVMGTIIGGAIATMVEYSPYAIWEVPDEWSLADAAAVPVVYLTALYALLMRAQLKRGQSILIHSGTGGVGLAAINVSYYFGCTIFVTVGTNEKREFLNKHYPFIKNSNIGCSRDTSFEQMIHRETNSRGVDIVLNSLSEEKLRASVRCLAKGGNFLEIGKFDLSSNNQLSIDLLAKGCTFHGIMLDKLGMSHRRQCSDVFLKALSDGYIKRIPKTIFKMDQLQEAFRYMSTGKHIGKVMINIKEEESDKAALPTKTLFPAVPRYFANPLSSYIIIGGLGGFGLELADWLIIRGAKNIILSSRNGVKTGYQAMRIRIWKSYDIKIIVSLEDVTTMQGCQNILKEANDVAPIEGIFNLGVVLKDGLIDNQTVKDFHISFGPKATTTTYLDKITRETYDNLKYFVVFSSVSCGRGNAGQTNYGMSNSIMERICEKRKKDGFPGLAIQWGAVGDVGLVAEMQKEATEIAIGGTLQQRMSSCLEMMDIFLRQDNPVVASMVIAAKSGMGGADNMVEAVTNIMGIRDLKTISNHSTLAELGMDSMMAVEIKQTLERDYDVFLSAQDMRNLSFARLIELNEQRENISISINSINLMDQFQAMLENIYDEKTFKLPIVKMPSNSELEDLSVIIFPGIEGTHSRLKTLSMNMKFQCICVQYYTNEDCREIINLVDSLYEHIRMNISHKKFQFVAHSFGSIIALEIASRLEKEGYLGNIVLIDGSPDLMQEFLKPLNVGTQEFEVTLICGLMSYHLTPEVLLKLKENLISASSFSEKQRICEEHIPSDIGYSKDIVTYMGYNIFNIITAIEKYKPTFTKIESKVTLFKPNVPTIRNFPDDLNLSLICTNNIEIKQFEGDHSTIIDNIKVAQDMETFFTA